MARRAQTRGEELANALSHGAGFVAALAAIPVLVVSAARQGGAADVVGGAVFGATVALLYLASTAYHLVQHGSPAKAWLRRVDHSAIYLLIAGTYTPFTLGVLGGAWGWSLFGVIWGLAVAGVVLKLTAGVRWPRASTMVYVAMGWLIVIAIGPLLERVPGPGIALLVAGGLAYTGGVVFYAAPRLRFAHFVWHLFVLAGTTLHFFAVLGYAV
jgi:hemolysin III